jgi:hypothetical protein
MTGENRQLVTNEPVEVHQDCRKITGHLKGICRIYPNLIKESWRMSIWFSWNCKHWEDLNRLCPKISPITDTDWKSQS